MGSPTDRTPNPTINITNWKCRPRLKKIDILSLNSILNDIIKTDEIDSAIVVLTNHVRTVVGNNTRTVPASSEHRNLSADVLELIRAKNAALRPAGKRRNLPASYRSISLLSCRDKLFEKILKTHLCDHLLGKGLMIDEQFGFRPIHSCPQQALRLVKYIMEVFRNKQKIVGVFFDVAKAFDRTYSSRFSRTIPRCISAIDLKNQLQRASDAQGRWFLTAVQFKYDNCRSRKIVDLDTPYLRIVKRKFRASCEAQLYHLIRRPRNVLIDPPDALTAQVESLIEANNTHN
ncbi:Probable RNA-directed DNA polymerase from transposon X-element [Eumeta japonica]|uniref:Probable RNA-directed DNA polymerase from transposon X-element n=1 Tax=Eumeta variegata TaxID=151549 RepID=A0A4C1V716_EUMVA|nr:Probable RNA-directed DNA polymerase from transposon X-element [Eumeta japonica]